MKRILVMLIVVLCIVLCSSCTDDKKENKLIEFEAGVFDKNNWNDTVGTYEGVVIPDEETAIRIAQAIFDGLGKGADKQPQHVFYDTEDEIWIVSFWEDYDGSYFEVGNDLSIAMQKKDGKVLRIWSGE